ncbi:MAG: N-acetylglucosamine-6-phosphate deacetylase [Alphaproteobacteria bacterium]
MKAQKRTDSETIETACGPNGRPVRYEIDKHGMVARVTPLVGVSLSEALVVTPGLVDIQVNGFAGVDFNAPGLTAEGLDRALAAMLSCGVTRCLPTLITAAEGELVDRLKDLDAAVGESQLGRWMVPGYHIEGPFLSPEDGYSGAHPAEHMRSASLDLVERLEAASTRPLMIMTVAPEVDGVIDLIAFLVARGIVCAIGHSGASRAQTDAAIEAGATMSTHLGNGLPHLMNKNESSLLVQLGRDQLMASFIADGIHIPKDILQSWLRAKTMERSMLVTDATAAAGAPGEGGTFTLGAGSIERHADGSVRMPGSRYLAGSAASMDQLVRNVMNWYGLTIGDALALARDNPLRALGLPTAWPAVDGPADFVEWDIRNGLPHVKRASIGPWIMRSKDWEASTRSA